MPKYCTVLINSLVAFVYLFVVSKLMGKKQIAQLTFVDYAIGISIGSIAAEYATDVDNPWYYYIIAIGVFFLLSLFISWVLRKAQCLKGLLQGKPSILIEDGKINFQELKKSKLDLYDLIALARTKNYFDLNDIAYAILETDGELSVLPNGNVRPVTAEDFKEIKLEQASLTTYIIIDGKLTSSGLNDLGVDEKWVLEKLGVKDKKELKAIAIASYDTKLDKFDIHYKDRSKNQNNNSKIEEKNK